MTDTTTRTLEDRVKDNARIVADVPSHWSDWFHHSALVLALLYEWRGKGSGKSVREWLLGVGIAEGDFNMVSLIEKELSKD